MKLLQRDLHPGNSIEDVYALLSGLGGFRPSSFTPVDGPPDTSVEVVGQFRGRWVSLCEAAPGRALPDYLARLELRSAIRVDDAPDIVIFTDAAHSAFVWTWRLRLPSGHLRYVEFNASSRSRQLRLALAALDDPGSGVHPVESPDGPVIDLLFRTLVPARERGTGAVDRLGTMLERIEALTDPDQLRMVWRRLRSFSILDEGCVDGTRLVGAATVLETVMVAALERMQSFVDDTLIQRDRRRPEHLRDLRALTEASEDPASDYDRVRYVRRLIVQQNLFATVTTRAAGRAVLRDLLGYAGVPAPGLALIDCNIWRRRHASPRGGTGTAQEADRQEEEVALHRKAWEMVRRVRLAGGELHELKSAVWQLQRRRQLLLRQLRDIDEEALAFGRPPERVAFAARVDDHPG